VSGLGRFRPVVVLAARCDPGDSAQGVAAGVGERGANLLHRPLRQREVTAVLMAALMLERVAQDERAGSVEGRLRGEREPVPCQQRDSRLGERR
jgi:hypothetical protein